MNYKLILTKGGYKLLHVPDNKIDLIYVNIGIKIGSDAETKETLEYSHFMEHLFTLLTSKKYSNGLENRNFLSQNNVKLNAENITKHTLFQFTMRKRFLNKFIDMLVNSLYDYYIDDKLFINEKNSVIEELNSIINNNEYNFETFVENGLFKNHTRSYTQEERLANVKKTRTKDIIDFFNKYYNPDNIVIGFYGNVDLNKIKKVFDDYLNQKNTQLLIKQPKPINVYTSENSFKMDLDNRINYLKENKKNCSLKIVFNIPYKFFDDEYYAIFSILNILSYDISSILINRLRNIEGLIYDLYALMDLDENNKKLSIVLFETSVETQKIVKVIKIILEELKKIKSIYLEEEIIKRYKESLKIKEINDSLTFNPLRLLDEYIKYLLWDEEIVKFNDEYKNFGNVDKKILKEISNTIFDFKNMYIFYNGTKNHNKEIGKLLQNI